MSTEKPVTSSTAANTVTATRKRGRPRRSTAPPRAAASVEAKRRAAAILEVLAGSRRPSEAATALGVTVPRYYMLEEQALRGLVAACEPRSLAGPRPETRLAQLEKQLRERERECARQQALVRAAQRTVGLAPPPKPVSTTAKTAGNAGKQGKSRRKRKPTVRALKAARVLQANSSGSDERVGLQPESAAVDSLCRMADAGTESASSKDAS
jgi:hypothetical protein